MEKFQINFNKKYRAAVRGKAALFSIRGEKQMKKKKKYNSQAPQIRLAMVFLLPWVIGLILFHIYPIVSTVYYSFTEYNLMKAPKFVGL